MNLLIGYILYRPFEITTSFYQLVYQFPYDGLSSFALTLPLPHPYDHTPHHTHPHRTITTNPSPLTQRWPPVQLAPLGGKRWPQNHCRDAIVPRSSYQRYQHGRRHSHTFGGRSRTSRDCAHGLWAGPIDGRCWWWWRYSNVDRVSSDNNDWVVGYGILMVDVGC